MNKNKLPKILQRIKQGEPLGCFLDRVLPRDWYCWGRKWARQKFDDVNIVEALYDPEALNMGKKPVV